MDEVDVLIVGGGPAGSSCAWALRESGLKVLVLDRARFPRDKTCAGWITPPVVEILQIDTAEYASTRTFQPITGFRTALLGGAEVETRYDEVVSYGIRRCEFDHYLLDRCGARTETGVPVKSIGRDGDRWQVNGNISARVVVGAGGHFCPVSRMLNGESEETPPLVTAQEIEFEVDEAELTRGSVSADTPQLFFCTDLNGYGWCFRKGRFLNIGLGHTDAQRLKTDLGKLRESLHDRGKVAPDIPAKMHGHAYWLYARTPRHVVDEAVLLIGDAAGLADARSGEGIRPAIESGLMAARVITRCHGDYRATRLQPYRDWLTRRFGRPCPTRFDGRVARSCRSWIGRALLRSRQFSRRVLLDRWFLHRDHDTYSSEPVRPAS